MKNMLSIEAFAGWCEKQPAEKVYDYGNPFGCAAAQYLKSFGVENFALSRAGLPIGWADALNPWSVGHGLDRYTFGALAARLRAKAESR